MTGPSVSLKERVQADVKVAMKSGDKNRLGTLRLMVAAIKQREIDERTQLDDSETIAVLEKMVKQRRESIAHYERANRQDLADAEKAEIGVLHNYLPQPLTDSELASLIDAAMSETAASGISDMGKVMAALRPKIQGRADMAAVSSSVRRLLDR